VKVPAAKTTSNSSKRLGYMWVMAFPKARLEWREGGW
jgi:hypothetical protein